MPVKYICLPQLINEEAGPDEMVEAIHDRAGQEQHLLPLSDVNHLTLQKNQLMYIYIYIKRERERERKRERERSERES